MPWFESNGTDGRYNNRQSKLRTAKMSHHPHHPRKMGFLLKKMEGKGNELCQPDWIDARGRNTHFG